MKSLGTIILVLASWAAVPFVLLAQDETPEPAVSVLAPEEQTPPAAPQPGMAPEEAGAEPEGAPGPEQSSDPSGEVVESAPPAPSEKVWVRRDQMVGIGQDIHVKANERVDQVVAIFGNVVVDGKVDDQIVVIGGRATINGPVGEAVLVLSNGELGPDASVRRDAVVVGGRLSNPHGVTIGGNIVSIEQHLPQFGAGLDWFREGLILGRPMVPSLTLTWIISGAFLAFYLFLALIVGRAVNSTASMLESRPGGTLLAALLFLPAFPLLVLLLLATGIGMLLVPFLMIAVFFAALFGKAAFLAFVGRAILRSAGDKTMGIAVLTTLIGGIIVTLLYGIWYLGMALWALTTWIGIGMVIMTIVTAIKRERPKRAAGASVPPPADSSASTATPPPAPGGRGLPGAPVAMPLSAAAAPGTGGGPAVTGQSAASSGSAAAEAPPPPIPPEPPPPAAPTAPAPGSPVSAVGFERAGFGIRLAAILIDVILVGAVVAPLGGGKVFAFFLGVYCALLWFYRGTSIGGIIFGLKIVRLDARPLDLPTAIVRTLGAFLSVICVGLGFLWVIWDPERQTWHDKIAGTTVIRVPKGMSLV